MIPAGQNTHNLVVFTDLDGTLLDHDTYSFQAALPALEQLRSNHIPVIPVTSKTCSELLTLRRELENEHPFVVENGAAIYFPTDYFPDYERSAKALPNDNKRSGSLQVHRLGKPRDYWCQLLEEIDSALKQCFLGFSELGVDGIVEETGLTPEAAAQANQREASEPLKWLGNDEALQRFIVTIEAQGGQVLRGGRFLHILDKVASKGSALTWLSRQYLEKAPDRDCYSVALGDADNDLSMLAAANQAVVIRSRHHPLPDTHAIANVLTSQQYGPAGWNETIQQILARYLNP